MDIRGPLLRVRSYTSMENKEDENVLVRKHWREDEDSSTILKSYTENLIRTMIHSTL